MSKLFSSKKLVPIKSLNNSVANINKSVQDIIDIYAKNNSYLSNINNNFQGNKNNITIDYPKYFSPSFHSTSVALPQIQKPSRRLELGQKKLNGRKLSNSNSYSNLYSQRLYNLSSPKKKTINRGSTQINIIQNEEKTIDSSKSNVSKNMEVISTENKKGIQPQINNITNINIHIYQNNNNEISDETNQILENSIVSKNKTENEINLNAPSNSAIDNLESLIQDRTNIINKPNNNSNLKNQTNLQNPNSSFNPTKKIVKKNIRGNIKILQNQVPGVSEINNITNLPNVLGDKLNDVTANNYTNLNYINNNSLTMAGSMIINSSNTVNSRILSTSLPDINYGKYDQLGKVQNPNNILLSGFKEESPIGGQEDINTSMNFLRDLSSNNKSFITYLKIIQNHLDIELLIDNITNTNVNSKGPTNIFRRKQINTALITTDKVYKFSSLVNNYFNLLGTVYKSSENATFIEDETKVNNVSEQQNNENIKKQKNLPIDNFFLFNNLNNLFHKIIKIQACLFSSILISLSQLGLYEINTLIKNHFHKILKDISNPLYNLFEHFVKEELNLNYSDLIANNLRKNFYQNYTKYIQACNINSTGKVSTIYKNTEIVCIISKNLDKAVNAMKYYSTLNLKYSLIKPYGDALNQMLYTIERKTLSQFVQILLNTILFGELSVNKNKVIQTQINNKQKVINPVNNNAPFLPPLNNNKYKYTLVLDMDETLVHFFFTHINGMFFVRPYCLTFLNELNDLYEIVTFTAGTKDYADNILNVLDINGNIIKYRLYRQHTTILGCNVYKDLNKLGRSLDKVIIIDNLKDNYKLQPNNGLFIKTWTSDINDNQFKDLLKILKDIVLYNVSDVRPIIQKINEEIKITRNLINPYASINISKYFTAK